VRSRAKLVTTIRGSLRAQGYRLGSCATRSFVARWATLRMEESLRQSLDPLVETIAELTDRITLLERDLYAEAKSDELPVRLQEIPGVGPLVALSFVAWVDRPERFATSRAVGASLGLRPILRSSGDRVYRGRITRQGDVEMRWLLVQAAHASFLAKRDSALKRWSQQLERRVGKAKAAVGLARKIGIVMHHLWVSGESYEPFPKVA
jgi:transposase